MGAAAIPFGIGAGLSLLQGQQNANAIKREARFRQQQLEQNKKIAEIKSKDAMERGEETVADFKVQAEKMQGTQLASLAAQGIEVDTGTAAQVRYETDKVIDTDIKRIRNNAWREAWGYKVEASNLGMESSMTGAAARSSAEGSLLSGVIGSVDYGVRAWSAGK